MSFRILTASPVVLSALLTMSFARAQGSGTSGSGENSKAPLQSGGLAPPPPESGPPQPSSAATPSSSTQRELDESDQKDTGRGLQFFYFGAEGGFEQVNLQSLHVSETLVPSTARTSDVGGMFGVGAGIRFLFVTIGPRFRMGHFHDWDIWTLNAELGWRVPLGNLEPYFNLGGGYAKMGSLTTTSLTSNSGVSIQGYNVRAGMGLDYYVTPAFSVGGSISGELLAMTRPGVSFSSDPATQAQQSCGSPPSSVSIPSGTMIPSDTSSAIASDPYAQCIERQALKQNGSSLGFAVTPSIVLSLHF